MCVSSRLDPSGRTSDLGQPCLELELTPATHRTGVGVCLSKATTQGNLPCFLSLPLTCGTQVLPHHPPGRPGGPDPTSLAPLCLQNVLE